MSEVKVKKKVEKKIKEVKKVEPQFLVPPEIGVETLKEATEAMFYILRVLMAEFKDGFDWNDIPVALAKLAGDEKFKESMAMAWSGRDKLAAETKDMSIPEAIELGTMSFNEVMAIVNIMKSDK